MPAFAAAPGPGITMPELAVGDETLGKKRALGKIWCTIDPWILPKARILPGKATVIVLASEFRD